MDASGRADMLSGLFLLLCIYEQIQAMRAASLLGSVVFYIVSLIAVSALAVLSDVMSPFLVCLIVLFPMIVYFLSRSPDEPDVLTPHVVFKLMLRYFPFLVILSLSFFDEDGSLSLSRSTVPDDFQRNPMRAIHSIPMWLLNAIYLMYKHISLLFMPWTLLCDYSTDTIPLLRSILDVRTAAVLCVLLSVMLACYLFWVHYLSSPLQEEWHSFSTYSLLLLGLCWLLLSTVPLAFFSPLLSFTFRERWLYSATVAVSLLFCGLFSLKGVKPLASSSRSSVSWSDLLFDGTVRGVFIVVLVASSLALNGYRTATRVQEWQSWPHLLVADVRSAPRNHVLLYHLGDTRASQGRMDTAISLWKRSLEIVPYNIDVLVRTSVGLQLLGRYEESVKFLSRAIVLDAQNPNTHFLLGQALFNMQQTHRAVRSFSRALLYKAEFPEAHRGMLKALQSLNFDSASVSAVQFAIMLGTDQQNESMRQLMLFETKVEAYRNLMFPLLSLDFNKHAELLDTLENGESMDLEPSGNLVSLNQIRQLQQYLLTSGSKQQQLEFNVELEKVISNVHEKLIQIDGGPGQSYSRVIEMLDSMRILSQSDSSSSVNQLPHTPPATASGTAGGGCKREAADEGTCINLTPENTFFYKAVGSGSETGSTQGGGKGGEETVKPASSFNWKRWFDLGMMAFADGNLDDCITFFQQSERLMPRIAEVRNNIGVTLLARFWKEAESSEPTRRNMTRFEEPINRFQEVIQIDPSLSSPYFHLCVIFEYQDKLEEALDYCQQGLEREPNSQDIRVMAEHIQHALRKKYESRYVISIILHNLQDVFTIHADVLRSALSNKIVGSVSRLRLVDLWTPIEQFKFIIEELIATHNETCAEAFPQLGPYITYMDNHANDLKRLLRDHPPLFEQWLYQHNALRMLCAMHLPDRARFELTMSDNDQLFKQAMPPLANFEVVTNL
eukprot:GILK01012793.1.p1 GENE.GILK01012793.1~~GILK01012793.1.p1  ORF type:complete len:1104 (-),score=154.29 GILK01012793.1:108-2963(-)